MSNRLINESSPYLLQHANNPVDWYPWSSEAFERAQSENKLVLISIGYSACHWCHVMEKESFENEDIANLMNQHFVCIKVDREEHADVDQIYMEAVQLMTRQGGWPLNCFALPNGKPVFGGTYFPPAKWTNVLETLASSYTRGPNKFHDFAEKLTTGIQDSFLGNYEEDEIAFKTSIKKSIEQAKRQIDMENGGFNGAPKFPLPSALLFLLEVSFLSKDSELDSFVNQTLTKMANSGLYDQIGGGFARYAVDEQWKVPHFEKMLYDNAQLISLYSKAYQINKNSFYKTIIEESLAFIEREMTNSFDGFYSALDADSEGQEGKYYVWTTQEVSDLLSNDQEFLFDYYQITKNGNWENGQNILYPQENSLFIADKYQMDQLEFADRIKSLKSKLLEIRQNRVSPGLDDKSISSWNALMIKAQIDAFKALGDQKILKQATKSAHFLMNLISEQGELKRIFKQGKSTIHGLLDDYAFTIDALLALYQITFDRNYLNKSILLKDYVVKHFLEPRTNLFFYTSINSENLIARKKEITDSVIPSSNSVMAHNLFTLGTILSDEELILSAKKMLHRIQNLAQTNGIYFSNWQRLLLRFLGDSSEVVIMGREAVQTSQKLQTEFLPLSIFAGSEKNAYIPLMENRESEKTLIYVCKNKSCLLPTEKTHEAFSHLKKINLNFE